MSSSNPSASGQPSGHPAASPEAVLNELKKSAERKASLKMYYAAADLFRDYKGPFSGETSAERDRLAAEYEQRGRVAEQQRLERGPVPIPQRPAPPAPASGPVPPREKPPVTAARPSSAPPPARKPAPAPVAKEQPPIEGPSVTWTCRWCNEKVSVGADKAGKLVPCPKCARLVRAPQA